MSESIHGHDVMHMMLESETPFTRETLKTAMAERFGAEAKFQASSASNYSDRLRSRTPATTMAFRVCKLPGRGLPVIQATKPATTKAGYRLG